jgi:hypothetical protein
MTIRRTLAALLVSVVITLVLACIYLFYPLVSALLSQTSGPETGGIAAVVGGSSLPGLVWLLLTETIVFVVTFGLLNRKKRN